MLSWYRNLKIFCILGNFEMDYKLYNQLGEGSYAKVFYAKKRVRNLEFAIKQYNKAKFADVNVERTALIKELDIMRKLNHKNIIHIYQIYEDEKYLNVVEDLLKGGDLLSNLSSYGRFDEVKTQKVMLPIFQALAYLHNTHNIMHRDLKPENVVLRNKSDIFDIVLCDFGLAEYHTKEGNYIFTRCGTPGYVAPEILKDQKYTHKVDCFSAGIIMFILLTGKSPFGSENHDEIVLNNLQCKIDFTTRGLDKRVSQKTMDLLRKLLALD